MVITKLTQAKKYLETDRLQQMTSCPGIHRQRNGIVKTSCLHQIYVSSAIYLAIIFRKVCIISPRHITKSQYLRDQRVILRDLAILKSWSSLHFTALPQSHHKQNREIDLLLDEGPESRNMLEAPRPFQYTSREARSTTPVSSSTPQRPTTFPDYLQHHTFRGSKEIRIG